MARRSNNASKNSQPTSNGNHGKNVNQNETTTAATGTETATPVPTDGQSGAGAGEEVGAPGAAVGTGAESGKVGEWESGSGQAAEGTRGKGEEENLGELKVQLYGLSDAELREVHAASSEAFAQDPNCLHAKHVSEISGEYIAMRERAKKSELVTVRARQAINEDAHYEKGQTFQTTPSRAAALGNLVEIISMGDDNKPKDRMVKGGTVVTR